MNAVLPVTFSGQMISRGPMTGLNVMTPYGGPDAWESPWSCWAFILDEMSSSPRDKGKIQ